MDLFEIGQAPRFERRGAAAHSKQVLKYNVRHPLKDPSSEEFVLGVEPVIEISLSD